MFSFLRYRLRYRQASIVPQVILFFISFNCLFFISPLWFLNLSKLDTCFGHTSRISRRPHRTDSAIISLSVAQTFYGRGFLLRPSCWHQTWGTSGRNTPAPGTIGKFFPLLRWWGEPFCHSPLKRRWSAQQAMTDWSILVVTGRRSYLSCPTTSADC